MQLSFLLSEAGYIPEDLNTEDLNTEVKIKFEEGTITLIELILKGKFLEFHQTNFKKQLKKQRKFVLFQNY